MPEVRLVNVTKRYGHIMANDNLNITIGDGEYVTIIGPSGCGKTTLIKSIAGITKPDEGEIYVGDNMVNSLPIEERGVGYVFQDIALFPHMTVWDNITYGPKVKGFSAKETRPLILNMLDMINLTTRSDALPHELSGGTQQKTAVARALAARATLLLLDEPLGALDLKVRAELRHELRRIVKDLGLTALHVTHDQAEAMSISDRIIVMKKGRIIESGNPVDLYLNPKHIFTANFVGEANFFTGVVTSVFEEGSSIEIGKGLQMDTKRKIGEKGERVVLAFRPEFASILEDEDPVQPSNVQNLFSGTVVNLLYSGNIVRFKVKLESDDIITVKKQIGSEKPKIGISDKVEIQIAKEDILLYAYPDEGLYKAQSLE